MKGVISFANQIPPNTLEIVFYKNKDKSYSKIVTVWGCSKSAAFTVCKKFFKSRTVQHLLWIGRLEKFTKIFEHHATLPVLDNLLLPHRS